jgi:hypothetical protein
MFWMCRRWGFLLFMLLCNRWSAAAIPSEKCSATAALSFVRSFSRRVGDVSFAECNGNVLLSVRGGGFLTPAGWNPFGYKITPLGEQFLSFGDSLSSDVGRFLASLKSGRKRRSVLKNAWLEIMRASKTAQAMRIYRTIDELLDFCLNAGLVD